MTKALSSSTTLSSAVEPVEHVFLFDADAEPTDEIDDAVVGVTVTDKAPAFYEAEVEVYGSDGRTLFSHSYLWDPNARDLPALDETTALAEARSAVTHMTTNAIGEWSTVLLDHRSGNVWHVAAPGTSGMDAVKDIDNQNSTMPRRYYRADLDVSDNGYDVYRVPTAIATDLAGQSKHDTALVQLFDCVEQIFFADADLDRDDD